MMVPDINNKLISDDPREGPDAHFDANESRQWPPQNADVELCPDHGTHIFTTMCGVTRCFYCNKVVG